MAHDILKPVGDTRASNPNSGGGAIRSTPMFGVVKNNIDPTRSGRLQVYIADIGNADPEDANSWVTVSYMSPFYGFVEPNAPDTGYGGYVTNPSSYGLWNSPPDIGTTVICLFINGDPSYGYYIGCVPKTEALHMVPAIGSSEKIIANEGEAQGYGGATRLPVTNINTNNASIADSANYLNEPKPVHSYSAMIMSQQGVIRDPVRGPISSSAQRETPSRVGWGVSTPGRPIYEGGFTDETIANAVSSDTNPQSLRVIARRGGHSIVMDDGDVLGQDQLVRIRTAKGHQILMSDDGQTLFILHSNGQSYIELGKEGTIDMYSTNSVNIRTHGDLNLHADNNININAAKNLNVHAENINFQSDQETTHKIGSNYKVNTTGAFTHKVDGPMSMQSAGEASYASSGTTFINGSRVNLNTGSSSTIPTPVPAIPLQAHTDTLYDSIKGYAAAPGKLISITSRAPAHAPWANAGQGVDLKTSLSASASLPASPSSKVTETINKAAQSPVRQPVSTATVATVPSTPDISKAIDKTATSAMVAAVAQAAGNNPAAADAIRKGAGIIKTAGGESIGAVGTLAQTPGLLETAGVLKPGSAALVDSLIKGGKTIQQAMPSNLFTGQMGATDLYTTVTNVEAQVKAQVANFQRTQNMLTSMGVISGKESSGSIAGLVLSGSNVGISQTVNAIKTITSPNGLIAGASSVVNEVTNAINSGNYAAAVSQKTLSGLASVVTAIDALDQLGMGTGSIRSKGTTGAAFASILNQFKALTAGVPQNLRVLAQEAATARSGARTNGIAGAVAGATGLPASSVGAIAGIAGAVGTLTTTRDTNASIAAGAALVNNISKVVSTMSASAYASGVNNLPGGESVVAAITNNSTPNAKLPGTQDISTLIKGSSSASVNGTSINTGISGAVGAVGGNAANTLSTLTGSVTDNLNKLKTGAATLSSLATSGLSSSAAAELTAAISAMSAISSAPINIPKIGIDTNDRSEQSAQITSLLYDPRIPAPNFSTGPSDASVSTIEQLKERNNRAREMNNRVFAQLEETKRLRKLYYEAENQYPRGAPEIEAAKKAWTDSVQAASALSDQNNREFS